MRSATALFQCTDDMDANAYAELINQELRSISTLLSSRELNVGERTTVGGYRRKPEQPSSCDGAWNVVTAVLGKSPTKKPTTLPLQLHNAA